MLKNNYKLKKVSCSFNATNFDKIGDNGQVRNSKKAQLFQN